MCIEYVSSGMSASWKHIEEIESEIHKHSLDLMNKEEQVIIINTVYSSHLVFQLFLGSSNLNSSITESGLAHEFKAVGSS